MLVRSTLSSLPIYLLSLFHILRIVHLRLGLIQRNFLWGGGNFEKKPHIVKWATICLDRKNGSLGVKDMARLNKALLSKWSWRFANERQALWNDVIKGKYGDQERGWCSEKG